MCPPPATVAAPIYYYFLSCSDFPTLQRCAQNRTTNNSFCLSSFGLVLCSLAFPFQFGSQNEGAEEIFLPQEISVSWGTVRLTSVTSLWTVSVTPTIQKNSCSIWALPVAPIWNCQLWWYALSQSPHQVAEKFCSPTKWLVSRHDCNKCAFVRAHTCTHREYFFYYYINVI